VASKNGIFQTQDHYVAWKYKQEKVSRGKSLEMTIKVVERMII
jgi:hypothetical protein